MAETEAVERDIFLSARPSEVWSAITEGDRVAGWFGAEARIELRPGGRATFRWPDGTTRNATVEVVEPERLLILRWFPFADDVHRGRCLLPATTLSFRLQAAPDGTHLRVRESAPAQGAVSEDSPPESGGGPGPSHGSRDLLASGAL